MKATIDFGFSSIKLDGCGIEHCPCLNTLTLWGCIVLTQMPDLSLIRLPPPSLDSMLVMDTCGQRTVPRLPAAGVATTDLAGHRVQWARTSAPAGTYRLCCTRRWCMG